MGMYTELIFKSSIQVPVNSPEQAVIQHLFNGADLPTVLPDHSFFSCSNWDVVTKGSSYYHHPTAWNNLVIAGPEYDGNRGYYVFSRADFKNYDSECEQFIDWINPYIYEEPGYCIGWTWYEEHEQPTLLFKR